MRRKVIRNSVFETNSSSCHSVSVRGKSESNYYARIIVNGDTVEVELDEYGWSGYPCDDFDSKLAYALSMVLHTEYQGFDHWDENFRVNQEKLEKCAGYKLLLDAINKHGDCEKIIIKPKVGFYPYGYIDHQSYENYDSLQDFLDDWNVDAERFLFDDNVVVHIDNDNG